MNTKMMLIPALFAALVIGASAPSHAATFAPAKRLKNPAMQAVFKAAQGFGKGSASGAYRVTQATDAHARAPKEIRLSTLKQAIHAYFGADFSDGIGIGLDAASTNGAQAALKDLNLDSNTDGEQDAAAVKALEAALEQAAVEPGIELYSGSASGNNTMGDLVGLYDTRNDELVYLGFSNFGSDD